MRLKLIFRSFFYELRRIPYRVNGLKVYIAEWIAIFRKYPIYRNIHWGKKEKAQFDTFWKKAYGRKIPNMWHRLYQASSGKFCVDYIPELLYSTRIEPLMNDYIYSDVIEDKVFVELLSFKTNCEVPQTIIIRSNGRYYDSNRSLITKSEAIKALAEEHDVVLKPSVRSSSGNGIKFFDQLNRNEAIELLDINSNDFIIQKRISQHPKFAKLNPSSINTIRITTYVINGKVYHMPLCLRIGRAGEKVDNIHAGGLGVGLTDEGVLLSEAYQLGYGDNAKRFRRHPDSNVLFENYRLPFIKEIIRCAYEVHGRYPHVGIISWDFTVNDQDKVVLIEANIRGQGIWFCQMIHGKGAFEKQTKDVLKLVRLNKSKQ